jgi:hypothetical protein
VTTTVWLYLLAKANWKDAKFKGCDVKRGQLITTAATIQEELKLSKSKVATALKHLQETGEIMCKGIRNRWTLVTIEKYEVYQGEGLPVEQPIKQPICNQSATDMQPIGMNEEEKELNNKKHFSYSPPPASYWSQDPIEQRKQHDARMAELRKQFGID